MRRAFVTRALVLVLVAVLAGAAQAMEEEHTTKAVKSDLLEHVRMVKNFLETKDRKRRSTAVDATSPCLAIRDQWVASHGSLPVDECNRLQQLIHMSTSDTLTCGGSILTQYDDYTAVESLCANKCFQSIVSILRLMVLDNEPCTPGMIFEDYCDDNIDCAEHTVCTRGRCEPMCDTLAVPSDCGCGESCLPANGGHICMRTPACNATTACADGMNCVDGMCFDSAKPILQQTTMYHFKTYSLLCSRDASSKLCYPQLRALLADPADCGAFEAMQGSCCLYTWASYQAGCAYDAANQNRNTLTEIAERCSNFVLGVVEPCAGYPSSAVTPCYSSVSASKLHHDIVIQAPADISDPDALALSVASRLGMSASTLYNTGVTAMDGTSRVRFSYEITTRMWPPYTDINGTMQVHMGNDTSVIATVVSDTRNLVRVIPAVRKSGGGLPSYLLGAWEGSLSMYGEASTNATCCSGIDQYYVTLNNSAVEISMQLEVSEAPVPACKQETGGRVRITEIEALTTPGTFYGVMDGLGYTKLKTCFYFDALQFAISTAGECPKAYELPSCDNTDESGDLDKRVLTGSFYCVSGFCKCTELDPCCFNAMPSVTPSLRGMSKEQMDLCLRAARIPFQQAQETLYNLRWGMETLYSYSDIARNSTLSVADVLPKYKDCFKVHPISVSMSQRLDEAMTIVRGMIPDLNGDGKLSKNETDYATGMSDYFDPAFSIRASDFHFYLARLFRDLRDKHTQYATPFTNMFFNLPFALSSRMENGKQVIYVYAVHNSFYNTIYGKSVDAALGFAITGTTIKEIDGIDALEWVKSKADAWMGEYKGDGVRFNSFLSRTSRGFTLDVNIPPRETTVSFKLASSSTTYTLNYVSGVGRLSSDKQHVVIDYGFAEYSTYINRNDVWGNTVRKFEKFNFTDFADARGEAMYIPERELDMSKHMTRVAVGEEDEEEEEETRGDGEENGSTKRQRRATVPPLTPLSFTDSTGRTIVLDTRLSQGRITGFVRRGVFIIKLTSFVADMDMGKFMTALFTTIANGKIYSKRMGINRMLVDLIGNPGGFIAVANAMLSALGGPEWQGIGERDFCEGYITRLSPDLNRWVSDFAPGLDRMVELFPEVVPDDRIIKTLVNLKKAAEINVIIGEAPTVNVTAVDAAMTSLFAIKSARERSDAFKTFVNTTKWCNKPCQSPLDPTGGWYPFDAERNALDTMTRKPFNPPLDYVLTPLTHTWGGVGTNYTRARVFGCLSFEDLASYGVRQDIIDAVKGYLPWTSMAIVSDGTCGSACSLFTTKMMLARNVTVYTYGGIKGQAMDSSSFAGGNVEEYDTLWRDILRAGVLGKIFMDNATRFEPTNLAVSMTTRASARFNYNMMQLTELGAKSLPREWYIIPGHRQFDFWATGLDDYTANINALQTLYDMVISDDWVAARESPQFYDARCTIAEGLPINPPTTTVKTTSTSKVTTTTAPTTAPNNGSAGKSRSSSDFSSGSLAGVVIGILALFIIWLGIAYVYAQNHPDSGVARMFGLTNEPKKRYDFTAGDDEVILGERLLSDTSDVDVK